MPRSSRLRTLVIPTLVLLISAAGTVLIVRAGPEVEKVTPSAPLPLVRVVTVHTSDVVLAVESQGSVAPSTESDLVAEVSGRIDWVAPDFREGGFVARGEELLRLDARDYEVAVRSASAQVAQARLAVAREEAEAEVARAEWQELGKGEPSPLVLRQPQVEEARARLEAAEAALEKAELDLERTRVRSPYDGRVRRKHVDLGEFVNRGTPLATVYGIDFAEVRLPVPDAELAYLDLSLHGERDEHLGMGEDYDGGETPGPEVTLSADFAGRVQQWQGRIVRTEGELDPQTRMVNLVARVAAPYTDDGAGDRPPLAVGMFVDARIRGRTAKDVVVLPRETLRGNGQMLVVDADRKIRYRDVDVLRAHEETVIVSGGLEEGERVVVSPLELAVDGMEVRIADSDAAGASE